MIRRCETCGELRFATKLHSRQFVCDRCAAMLRAIFRAFPKLRYGEWRLDIKLFPVDNKKIRK